MPGITEREIADIVSRTADDVKTLARAIRSGFRAGIRIAKELVTARAEIWALAPESQKSGMPPEEVFKGLLTDFLRLAPTSVLPPAELANEILRLRTVLLQIAKDEGWHANIAREALQPKETDDVQA